jgi:prepilin-type N-terminal cleavage/methylation domain-containing protein
MTKKGFTLVEIMVVVGILSIIMLVISQPLASVIKYQRESQTADNMRDNLQFVINKIEKEIKTGYDFGSSSGSNIMNFKDQESIPVGYKLEGGEIKKNNISITDKNIFKVNRFRWWNSSSNKLITLVIEASSLDDKDTVTMQISVLPLND